MTMDAIVKGLDDLQAGLSADLAQLEVKTQRRGLKQAAYAGAAVARDAIRAAAPKQSGDLAKAIVAASAKAGGDTLAIAGVKVKDGRRKKYANTKRNRRKRLAGKTHEEASPAYYWRFVEQGSSKARAHPFVRPAFDANEGAIGEAIAKRLGRFLDETKA